MSRYPHNKINSEDCYRMDDKAVRAVFSNDAPAPHYDIKVFRFLSLFREICPKFKQKTEVTILFKMFFSLCMYMYFLLKINVKCTKCSESSVGYTLVYSLLSNSFHDYVAINTVIILPGT